MKKTTMNKMVKFGLTGALALGALGIGSMSDLPIPGLQASQADANGPTNNIVSAGSTVSAPALNAISTKSFIVESAATSPYGWFDATPRFIIKNSVGTVVKTGSMSAVTENLGEYSSTANISLAGLPKNASNYRIDFTWQATDGLIGPLNYPSLTKAFTYNADGSITNIRN